MLPNKTIDLIIMLWLKKIWTMSVIHNLNATIVIFTQNSEHSRKSQCLNRMLIQFRLFDSKTESAEIRSIR